VPRIAGTEGGRFGGVVLAILVALASAAPVRGELPTALVLGLRAGAAEGEAWRDRRLGMGIRGLLVQMLADSGAVALIEERELAPSVQDALGGYWLEEREAALDAASVRRQTGVDWVAYGEISELGVTRDTVRGPVGGRRWRYRVVVTLCLDGAAGAPLCADGEGTSVTRVMGAIVEYRGDQVAFDQAGPAQAVDRALARAFNELMPRWAKRSGE
jgi:hypothetical protein